MRCDLLRRITLSSATTSGVFARAAQATDFLWLSTIICAEPEATVVEGNYRGRLFGEAVEHPLAGVDPQSFQPTIGSLADILWAGGFSEIKLWKNR